MLKQLSAIIRNLDLIAAHFAGYGPLIQAELRSYAGSLTLRIVLFIVSGVLANAAIIAAALSLTLCLARVVEWSWPVFAAPLGLFGLALLMLAIALSKKMPQISATLTDQLGRDAALFRSALFPGSAAGDES